MGFHPNEGCREGDSEQDIAELRWRDDPMRRITMPLVTLTKDWARSPTQTEKAGTTVWVDTDTARWLLTQGYVHYPADAQPNWVHMTGPDT